MNVLAMSFSYRRTFFFSERHFPLALCSSKAGIDAELCPHNLQPHSFEIGPRLNFNNFFDFLQNKN